MGSHIVGKDPEHRAVEIGIKGISCVQLQGSVTIQRDGRGEKFAIILGGHGKEIGDLSAFQIRDREAPPRFILIFLPEQAGMKYSMESTSLIFAAAEYRIIITQECAHFHKKAKKERPGVKRGV